MNSILLILIGFVSVGNAADIIHLIENNRCTGCKTAVEAIAKSLDTELPVLMKAAETVCNSSGLSSEVAAVCSQVVEGLPTVAKAVVDNLPAGPTCTMAKYCSSFVNPLTLQAMKGTSEVGVNWGPVECNFCKMMFDFIQQNFLDPQFQQAILMEINKICTAIGGKSGEECTNILGSYGDMILKYIQSLLSGDHICPIIKMCPAA